MECQKIFDTIEQLYDEYVQVWEDICNIESPTNYKEGVDAVGRYIMALAEKKGWKSTVCHQDVSGDVVCITMNSESKLEPVSISGHIDTVHRSPVSNPRLPERPRTVRFPRSHSPPAKAPHR